jgi:hypothetical protein
MRLAFWLCVGVFALSAACATASKDNGNLGGGDGKDGGAGEAPPETTTIPGGDDGTAPPHALGTIVLGEARVSETGDSTPVISASFLPDSKKKKACTRQVGSCEMVDTPKCMTGAVQGCASGEVCTFDDNCAAKCVKACTKTCAASEECFFSPTAPIEDQGMACRKRERFDAGAIAFNGTTAAITLFPPYSVKPDGNGAPFMAKSQIRVQASGAAGAGFERFDEKFTTTSFLQTDPPLADLSKTQVFGTGPVTIGWVPGDDHVVITASGPMGVARCVADDTAGTYNLERQVINAVLGTSTTTTPNLTLSVSRERRELKKDKKVSGELAGQTVQPTGWLEFVTSSTETHSFAACSTGYTACGETCTNLMTDAKNCGACGKACPTSYYCSSGTCRY